MEQVKGEQARSMGLVDSLTDNNTLEVATKMSQKLLSSPLKAMIATKMLYHAEREDDLKIYLSREQKVQWKLRQTTDHQEGVRAFLEKRQPEFQGKRRKIQKRSDFIEVLIQTEYVCSRFI